MTDLFTTKPKPPLAELLRPKTLDEFVGQRHLLGPGKPLRLAFEAGKLHSFILWGPPGVGKTTLGRLAASATDSRFIAISAVLAGVKDIRQAIDEAQAELDNHGRSTVLFVDEIHRFNKAQQDALLPHVESGLLTLVGGTTEHPGLAVNSALLSRAQVYTLEPLSGDELNQLYERALPHLQGVTLDADALDLLKGFADGDGRRFLNLLEQVTNAASGAGKAVVEEATGWSTGGATPSGKVVDFGEARRRRGLLSSPALIALAAAILIAGAMMLRDRLAPEQAEWREDDRYGFKDDDTTDRPRIDGQLWVMGETRVQDGDARRADAPVTFRAVLERDAALVLLETQGEKTWVVHPAPGDAWVVAGVHPGERRTGDLHAGRLPAGRPDHRTGRPVRPLGRGPDRPARRDVRPGIRQDRVGGGRLTVGGGAPQAGESGRGDRGRPAVPVDPHLSARPGLVRRP